MKIAIWHNLPSGGGKRALHDHVRGLVERGHGVEMWCPTTADTGYMPLGRYGTEHVLPLEVPPPRLGTRLRRLTSPYWEMLSRIEAVDEHCRACGEQIRAGGFDLLFANSCHYTATSPIARHVDIPSILYLQEPARYLYEARDWPDSRRLVWTAPKDLPLRLTFKSPPVTPGRWRGFKWQIRMFGDDLARAHGFRLQAREEVISAKAHRRILCNSYFSRESILRAYGIPAKVCYLGIDRDAFGPIGEKRPFVVGLGSIDRIKQVEAALQAIATVGGRDRPELVWIGNSGEAAYQQQMTALAGSLGVKLTIRRLIPQAELSATLAAASVMIYTPMLEPFGYAPLEANACGTAVVGWAEGGVRETVKDGVNGSLVEPGDYRATGQALLRYTRDLDFARREGLRARRHVEEAWPLSPAIDRLEQSFFEAIGP